jgi:hypothetical protein
MALQIVENYIDPAGYRRVRVQRDDGECMLFKFNPGMTVAEMHAQAQLAIDAEIAARQAANTERNRIAAITNGVALYGQGSLTLAQKGLLLDALAAEWKG